jgi:hypothetical protein
VRLARRGASSLPPSRHRSNPRLPSRVLQGVNGPALIGSTSPPRTHGTPRMQASILRNTSRSCARLPPLSSVPSLTQVSSASCSRARASDWLRPRQLLPMTLAFVTQGAVQRPVHNQIFRAVRVRSSPFGSCTCLCANHKARGGDAQGWRVAWYATGAFSALAIAPASGRAVMPVAHRVRV